VPGFDQSAIRLTAVRTEILRGFIFVNFDCDAQPMDVWLPRAEDELRTLVPNIRRLPPPTQPPDLLKGRGEAGTYNIQPQGRLLRHTPKRQSLDRMSYPIDPDADKHAGDYPFWSLWPTFSPGSSGRCAEHLSLAAGRRRPRCRLTGLTRTGRRR
jgi:hypothetical protein